MGEQSDRHMALQAETQKSSSGPQRAERSAGSAAGGRPSAVYRRRQRLSGPMAFAILGAMVLCVLVTWDRDRDERAYRIAWMEACRAELQERLDKAGALPPESFLRRAIGKGRGPEAFISPAGRTLIGRLPEPVVVAYSPLVRQYLRYHGRVVILLEGGQLRVEWWNSGRLNPEWRKQQRLIEELTREAQAEPPRLP